MPVLQSMEMIVSRDDFYSPTGYDRYVARGKSIGRRVLFSLTNLVLSSTSLAGTKHPIVIVISVDVFSVAGLCCRAVFVDAVGLISQSETKTKSKQNK